MKLTDEEQAMLAGDLGRGVQKAMEIITALGTIYGADDLVPVTSVQVAGVSYKNLGDAGLEFLLEWTEQGAYVRVPTRLNPAGVDLDHWEELGFDADFAAKQQRVIQTFAAMGIQSTCTCTPYYLDHVPAAGDHIAWAESSAVSFANSVLGARTNREGGPSALAAAISGRTARFGLHLEQNRRAQLIVDVQCPVVSFSDFGALGTIVGKIARNRVPYFRHVLEDQPNTSFATDTNGQQENSVHSRSSTLLHPSSDLLKALGAAMAASGAVPMFHINGVTPEATNPDIILPTAETVVIQSLDEGYAALNSDSGTDIDLVWFGCPHASIKEVEQIIGLLNGRTTKVPVWVTMARVLRIEAARRGLVSELEALGGKVVADTCLVVAPMKSLGFRRIATASSKGAYYTPGHSGLAVRYGTLEACVESAITGRWEA
jgi:predicted aconitase